MQRWESTKPTLYTLGRTAFGLSLFASLAVGAALLATLSAANEGEQRRETTIVERLLGAVDLGPVAL